MEAALMAEFGDAAPAVADMSLRALFARLRAAAARRRERQWRAATMVSAIVNNAIAVRHQGQGQPRFTKPEDFIGGARGPVDAEAFYERERLWFDDLLGKVLAKGRDHATAYAHSRRGRECRLVREAIARRREHERDAARLDIMAAMEAVLHHEDDYKKAEQQPANPRPGAGLERAA